MNTETGHVVSDIRDVPLEQRGSYTLLPRWMRKLAEKELRGRRETTVALDADTPLANFARARRQAAEEKRERRRARNLRNR